VATLTLKNVPDKLYSRLKKSAKQHRRSINSEAIVRLEEALASVPRDPQAILAEIRAFRESLGDVHLTDAIIESAKREGRP
jgi:plasmid stability protein